MKLDLFFFFLVIDDTLVCKIYITKLQYLQNHLRKIWDLTIIFLRNKYIHTQGREKGVLAQRRATPLKRNDNF